MNFGCILTSAAVNGEELSILREMKTTILSTGDLNLLKAKQPTLTALTTGKKPRLPSGKVSC